MSHVDPNSPSSQANSPHGQLSEQADAVPQNVLQNYDTRMKVDLPRLTGTPAQIAFDQSHPLNLSRSTMDDETQIGMAIGYGVGIIGGWLLSLLGKRFNWFKSKKGTLNPLYRAFKSLACAGLIFGMLIANLLPLPQNGKKLLIPVIADIGCIVFGIFAIPYWLIRHYVLKIDPETNDTYSKLGPDGWSKYTKMFLVWGTSLGQIMGYFYSQLARAPLTTSMNIVGGIAGSAAFFLALILVPTINKISEVLGYGKILHLNDDKKNLFSNNYVRSGITFGAAIGFALGGPLGSAIGSVIGGMFLGLTGYKITSYIQQKWLSATPDTENRWDYPTRTTSFAGASIGCLIGFFLPIPGGALLGSAIGGALGWFVGFPVIKIARKIQPEEEKSTSLPWSQRVATEVNRFAMIGMIVGAVIGLILGGPGGAVAGGTLGGAIGGVIGTLRGVFYGKEARAVMKKAFNPEPEPIVAPIEAAPQPAPALKPDNVATSSIAPIVAGTAGIVAVTAGFVAATAPAFVPAAAIAAAPVIAATAATVAVAAVLTTMVSAYTTKAPDETSILVEPQEHVEEKQVPIEPVIKKTPAPASRYGIKLPSIAQLGLFGKQSPRPSLTITPPEPSAVLTRTPAYKQ